MLLVIKQVTGLKEQCVFFPLKENKREDLPVLPVRTP